MRKLLQRPSGRFRVVEAGGKNVISNTKYSLLFVTEFESTVENLTNHMFTKGFSIFLFSQT